MDETRNPLQASLVGSPLVVSFLNERDTLTGAAKARSTVMSPRVFETLRATFSRTVWHKADPDELAERLGIAKAMVPAALAELVQANLLNQQGYGRSLRWRLAEKWDWARLSTPDGVVTGSPVEGEPLSGDDYADKPEMRLSPGPAGVSARRFQGNPFAPPPEDLGLVRH